LVELELEFHNRFISDFSGGRNDVWDTGAGEGIPGFFRMAGGHKG
jgi:hypothetical protein